MTGGLPEWQITELVALVRDAIDVRGAYERIACEPAGPEALPDWDRRSREAHEAALAAERVAVAAIRRLRGVS